MKTKMDLRMMYIIRDALVSIKKEMDEKGMTFDEFLDHYEKSIKMAETARGTGA